MRLHSVQPPLPYPRLPSVQPPLPFPVRHPSVDVGRILPRHPPPPPPPPPPLLLLPAARAAVGGRVWGCGFL
ncbi:unnamed protein product [Closterium sp. NIES-53]